MKTFFVILAVAFFLTSCNSSSENATTADSTVTNGSDSAAIFAPVTTDSIAVNSDSASSKMNPTTTTDTAK